MYFISLKYVLFLGCTENELKAMGDRLLDWFSVVMTDHRRGQSRRRSFRLSHSKNSFILVCLY